MHERWWVVESLRAVECRQASAKGNESREQCCAAAESWRTVRAGRQTGNNDDNEPRAKDRHDPRENPGSGGNGKRMESVDGADGVDAR